VELASVLDYHHLFHILDNAQRGGIARRVATNGTGIRVGYVMANVATFEMDGIGPADLEIESLVDRVASGGIKEVILALSATMEGDTTNFYIFRKLAPFDVKITIIARGVSIGGELEYTDEITLGRSILNRTLFSESFKG